MARIEVCTAQIDAWHCERHIVEADTPLDACQAVSSLAGESEDYWTACEPGETVVDEITEIGDTARVSHSVPLKYQDGGDLRILLSTYTELNRVLIDLLQEAGEVLSARTMQRAVDAIRQAERHIPMTSLR
jgi:hypothetical protein